VIARSDQTDRCRCGTRITPITIAYTLKPRDDLVLVNTTGIAVTVDATHAIVGKVYGIKLVGGPGSGVLVKTPTGSLQLIDGAASQTIATAYGFLDLVTDGSNWFVVAKG